MEGANFPPQTDQPLSISWGFTIQPENREQYIQALHPCSLWPCAGINIRALQEMKLVNQAAENKEIKY